MRHLPPGSATWAARDGYRWNDELELLALNAELTDLVFRQVAMLGGAKSVPKPLDIPRPHTPRARGRGMTLPQFLEAASRLPRGR